MSSQGTPCKNSTYLEVLYIQLSTPFLLPFVQFLSFYANFVDLPFTVKFNNGIVSGLAKHMRTHNKESNFRCDVCHQNFKLQADLKAHCVNVHKNEKAECNVCKSKLSSGFSVYLHSMRHSGLCPIYSLVCKNSQFNHFGSNKVS